MKNIIFNKNKFVIVIPIYNDILTKNLQYNLLSKSWEKYCKKYEIDLIYLNGKKDTASHICFERWEDFEVLPHYKRITFLDVDTYIREDAPNFFEIFEQENYNIVAVPDQGGSGPYHLNQWRGFNPNWDIMSLTYFNAGFISFPKDLYIDFSNKIVKYKEYYFKNKGKDFHPIGVGIENGIRMDALDQTGVNLCIQKEICILDLINPIFNYQPWYHHPELRFDMQVYTDQNRKQINNLDFLQKAYAFHFGSMFVNRTNIAEILNKLEYE